MSADASDALSMAEKAIREYGRSEYRRCVGDGLAVAERIRGWLTRQPDNPWQADVRAWAEKAIADVRRVWTVVPAEGEGEATR